MGKLYKATYDELQWLLQDQVIRNLIARMPNPNNIILMALKQDQTIVSQMSTPTTQSQPQQHNVGHLDSAYDFIKNMP
jgi:hypothetical protein